ncbi:class I SAM-dependent methyltransferase [Lentzea albidocapillata]|nr:class I SAM-dependent methyltransferase [Lentzea albidocapillata]
MSTCLWGTDHEPLLDDLLENCDLAGARVLDAGCGEGRNAAWLARQGAEVTAVDVSALALENARAMWPDEPGITWQLADLVAEPPRAGAYDVVVCDSVLHWMPGRTQVAELVQSLQQATSASGLHVVCAFNDRKQELGNHVNPPRIILAHEDYLNLYAEGWSAVRVIDEDITSSHADVPQPHNHSVTKFLVRRVS